MIGLTVCEWGCLVNVGLSTPLAELGQWHPEAPEYPELPKE
jgi:hypothetical protein